MKLRVLSIILALCVLASFTLKTDSEKPLPNTAYKAGESLKYLLYYGFVDGGKAEFTLTQSKPVNGNEVLHAKAEAHTTGMARWFIALDDVYESYFLEKNGKPIKAIRNIKENKYKYYDEVTYNHEANTVTSKKNGTISVPENIYDIISSVYYLRRQGFNNVKLNDTITIMTYFADEIFPYRIIFKGKETISTKLGKIKSLKFQPIVETGRVFKEQDDMRFWISDDANFLPLRVEFDMFVGSIKCDLIDYKNVKNPIQFEK